MTRAANSAGKNMTVRLGRKEQRL